MFGLNETTSKTFPNLPPHWSLSVRFDVLMFSNMDSNDYLKVYLDSNIQGLFSKPLFSGYPICSLYDNLFFYNKNLTSHTASSITVGINADTDQGITVKGIAMRNFFLYVDTCDISCATCNGPTNVRKCIISNNRFFKFNLLF